MKTFPTYKQLNCISEFNSFIKKDNSFNRNSQDFQSNISDIVRQKFLCLISDIVKLRSVVWLGRREGATAGLRQSPPATLHHRKYISLLGPGKNDSIKSFNLQLLFQKKYAEKNVQKKKLFSYVPKCPLRLVNRYRVSGISHQDQAEVSTLLDEASELLNICI